MATVKVKLRASSVNSREGTLYYQVIHDRTARWISTEYKVRKAEWDVENEETITDKTSDASRRAYLMVVNEGVKLGKERIGRAISNLEHKGKSYVADDIVEEYARLASEGGFIFFLRNHIEHLLKSGRSSAAGKVRNAMNSLLRFIGKDGLGKDDIPFECVDSELLEEYEGWLRMSGACRNTVSFYMRILRAVYNIAVARGLTEQRKPFLCVYTGIDKTVKRAVPLKTLSKIYRLDLSSTPELDRARNLFLFSFYMRGMSFVDMCFLRRTDLVGVMLTYRRQKTGQLMRVRWEKPMQQLLDRLGVTGTKYLLPIINDDAGDVRRQYENALRRENRNLKVIGRMIGLDTPLTTYVARHSWASVAQSQNIPISAISEGLGHNSVSTTKIYLASLDTSAVDLSNNKVLRALCNGDGKK